MLLQDLRYALRVLAKSRGYAAVALVTLALGIGANTLVFSIVNAVLLKRLPYAEPNQIVSLGEMRRGRILRGMAMDNFLDWRERGRVFDHMATYGGGWLTLTGRGDPVRLTTQHVSAALFPLLRVSWVVRFFPRKSNLQQMESPEAYAARASSS